MSSDRCLISHLAARCLYRREGTTAGANCRVPARGCLLIGLPPSFEKKPNRRYPVLFILDAQWDFSLVFMSSGGLRHDEVAPEKLLVRRWYAGTKSETSFILVRHWVGWVRCSEFYRVRRVELTCNIRKSLSISQS